MRRVAFVVLAFVLTACRVGDLLNTPVPPNSVDPGHLQGAQGAQALLTGAIGQFSKATNGAQIAYSGLLADEFRYGFEDQGNVSIDARAINPLASNFDFTYAGLQKARGAADKATHALERQGGSSAGPEIGQAFALEGYAILLLGEDVCAGVPLSDVDDAGTVTYGRPLPTDSLMLHAVAVFDSALAHAGGDPQITGFAQVGLGRAMLSLRRYSDAATGVQGVPSGFSYWTQLADAFFSVYRGMAGPFPSYGVADQKGVVGLPFVSAADPRVPIQNLGALANGLPYTYPLKFPFNASTNDSIPFATGVEASLIRAEALLPINGGSGQAWLDTLNVLRTNGTQTGGVFNAGTGGVAGLTPLTDPGTPAAQVDLLFRERAFWMFGTGHRLGDLRRLVRAYGRDQSTVFPSGPYDGPRGYYANFGTDVNFPIVTPEAGNPYFRGCLDRNA